MRSKKLLRAEKDPDKLKKVIKSKKKAKVQRNGHFTEEEDFVDMEIEDGFRNHGFESFDDEEEL
jgi:hypothetical protein